MVEKILEKDFDKVTGSEVAVVDFSATWCGPCKMLAPVLEEVSQEMGTVASFFNVDVDQCPNLAMKYGIMNIPAVAVFKNGERVNQQVGFMPKAALTDFIKGNM